MIQPEESFARAVALVAAATDEVLRREAVSRLYYAVFLGVCQRLELALRGAHVHEQLLQALRDRRDAESIRAANRLNSLRKLRTFADYEPDGSFSGTDLQSAMHHANAVRSLLGIKAG